eukprot:GHVL01021068.1.p1 GENE.GHVL01021068.1~~GHVL01021068.1.p1  ORF type:complete len:1304 (+),score=185.97 GHVL01021068.1:103-4014(+)
MRELRSKLVPFTLLDAGIVCLGYLGFVCLLFIWSLYRNQVKKSLVNKHGELLYQKVYDPETNILIQIHEGYITSYIGLLLKWILILLVLFTQIILFIITYFEYSIDYRETYKTFDKRGYIFIIMWILSLIFVLGTLQFTPKFATFFNISTTMEKCDLIESWKKNEEAKMQSFATDALTKYTNGFLHWCHITFMSNRPGGQLFTAPIQKGEDGVRYFDLHCQRFIWQNKEMAFLADVKDLELIGTTLHKIGKGKGLTKSVISTKIAKIGYNRIHVPVPGIMYIMATEFWVPTSLMQVFCCWCIFYVRIKVAAVVWAIMLLISVLKTSFLLRRNKISLQKMTEAPNKNISCVKRDGKEEDIYAENLVPGDIVLIKDNWPVPADIVILSGLTIVDESSLTGESMPVQKFPAPVTDAPATPEDNKKNYLYAGTKVLTTQKTGDHPRGVVVYTGSTTSKGHLIRDILYPKIVQFKYDEQFPSAFVILSFYALLMILAQGYFLGYGVIAFLYGIGTFSQVLPVWTPVLTALAQAAAAARLQDTFSIYTLSPARIAICGKVRVMCFDKTGTLTKEGIDFIGVHVTASSRSPNAKKQFEDPIFFGGEVAERGSLTLVPNSPRLGGRHDDPPLTHDLEDLPLTVLSAIASAHTLSTIEVDGEKKFIGSELEQKMFEATQWKLLENAQEYGSRVVPPHGLDPDEEMALDIIKAFEFDHGKQTMSVVIRNAEDQLIAYCKGSYEKIKDMCTNGVPDDFLPIAMSYAMQGVYVLAVGMKMVEMPSNGVEGFQRQDIESNLTMISLLLFRNELKPETVDCISQLRTGKIRPVIITGDNALTAIFIGRKSGITTCPPIEMVNQSPRNSNLEQYDVILGQLRPGPTELGDINSIMWENVDLHQDVSPQNIFFSDEHQELAITQSAFDWLLESTIMVPRPDTGERDVEKGLLHEDKNKISLLECIIMRIRIFSRMTPAGKVKAVQQFMMRGYITGMCGDGGNDCGALRAAHAGMALSDTESSIVSPFSSKTRESTSVPQLLREGRATLVATLSAYKFLVMYGLISTGARLWLSAFANSGTMSEWGYILIDSIILLSLPYVMNLSKPISVLKVNSPTSSLLGPHTVLSVASIFITNVVFLGIIFVFLHREDWFTSCYEKLNTIPISAWYWRSDNYEAEIVFLWAAFSMANAGLQLNFGGNFREPLYKNIYFLGAYGALHGLLLFFLFGGPSYLTCLFRVQCNNEYSKKVNIPWLSWLSYTVSGGKFMGLGDGNVFPMRFRIILTCLLFGMVLTSSIITQCFFMKSPTFLRNKKAKKPLII